MDRRQKELDDIRQSLRESFRERRLLHKEIEIHKRNLEVLQSSLAVAERERRRWVKTQAAADVWNRVAALEDENRKVRNDHKPVHMLSNASVSNVFKVIRGEDCDRDGADDPMRTNMEISIERPAV